MMSKDVRAACGVALLLVTASTMGQYDLAWFTIDGGGQTLTTGGDYELSGTVGQPDAGVLTLTGGDFELAGGFWPGATAGDDEPCFGDLDGDDQVGLSDLAQLLANYGEPSGMTYEDGDLDGDGDVDLSDLAALLAAYGTSCE